MVDSEYKIGGTARFVVSKETFDIVMIEVQEKMKQKVPALRNIQLSQNYIIWRMAMRYIDIDPDQGE